MLDGAGMGLVWPSYAPSSTRAGPTCGTPSGPRYRLCASANSSSGGIATQSWWLARGLDPTLKSVRLANYLIMLRKDLLALSRACGLPHPSLVTPDHLEILDDQFHGRSLRDLFGDPGERRRKPAA